MDLLNGNESEAL
jgi:hypothetical protein